MIRTPASSKRRLARRLIALSAVFVVGAFLAQGEAADAQQLRYSTEQSVVRLTVAAPVGVGASTAGRSAVAGHRGARALPDASLPPGLHDLRTKSAPELRPSVARVGADVPEPRRHATSVRGPPSPFR